MPCLFRKPKSHFTNSFLNNNVFAFGQNDFPDFHSVISMLLNNYGESEKYKLKRSFAFIIKRGRPFVSKLRAIGFNFPASPP